MFKIAGMPQPSQKPGIRHSLGLSHASNRLPVKSPLSIVNEPASKVKKKVRKTPEPARRDAVELMIDDFRLMIVVESGPRE